MREQKVYDMMIFYIKDENINCSRLMNKVELEKDERYYNDNVE